MEGSLSNQFDQTDDRYHSCDEANKPSEGGNERDITAATPSLGRGRGNRHRNPRDD
jgi:hypothetical protein